MRLKRIVPGLCVAAISTAAVSCQEDMSDIGSSIVTGEVTITVDSAELELAARPVEMPSYDSRSTFNLIGRLSSSDYGDLRCSFIGQLMSTYNFPVPDSIPSSRVDSVLMIMSVPRGYLTGDSLAPQQISVYALDRQLPADIKNNFDPTGYYDPSSPIGRKSYTLSEIANNDSVFAKASYIHVKVRLPREIGVKAFDTYRSNPEIFQWPETFAKYFPGIYIEPSFGRGCVASVAGLNIYTYYHHFEEKTVTEDSVSVKKQVTVKDSVDLFSISPEALNSNNITYNVSDKLKQRIDNGEIIITTPGGYAAELKFPAREIISRYEEETSRLKVISSLTFALPASGISNDYDIPPCPYMLLIKKSEMDDFFTKNKIPDSRTSFWAQYDSTNGRYDFSSMRNYILDLIDKGEVTEEDETFMLIPVLITTEEVKNQYYGTSTIYVVGCEHFISRPTMTKIFTDRAQISFMFSQQTID